MHDLFFKPTGQLLQEFIAFLQEVQRRLEQQKEDSQTVLLLTDAGSIYQATSRAVVDGVYLDENDLVQRLVENGDTRILYLAAVWHGQTVDMPSRNLRQQLLEIHGENRNASVLLRGANGLHFRPLNG